jgi:hypothetical protein
MSEFVSASDLQDAIEGRGVVIQADNRLKHGGFAVAPTKPCSIAELLECPDLRRALLALIGLGGVGLSVQLDVPEK